MKKKLVSVIGGGTGTYVVLQALKNLNLEIKAIVSMMDSGGSTGRLRDQLGVLPPGDLRQCLVALSDAPILWRKLFLYRFEKGDLKGHNFGNIFLSALEKVAGNYQEVIETASFILKTKGEVIPVTFEKTDLGVKFSNGKIITGEGKIDNNKSTTKKIIKAFLTKKVNPNPKAVLAIKKSDFIIIGPGDLYTSLIPPLLVEDISKAIKNTKAKIIFIVNLMTKSGQTTNFTATNHLETITQYLKRQPNIVLVNNGKIPKDILKWYINHSETIVKNNLTKTEKLTIIEENLVDLNVYQKNKADRLERSILRHNPKKLQKVLQRIFYD